MKKIQRLTAALLLIATLMSFVVPATFADGSATTTFEYQITLYNAESDQGYNDWFNPSKAMPISDIKTKLDEKYAAGELNWTYVDSAAPANLTYRTGQKLTLRAKNGQKWTALKVRVPQAGNYALTYSVDLAKATNTATITAYAIPADVYAAGSVDALIADDTYSLGAQAMAATDATITFAEKDYAAGEYVIVYKSSENAAIFLTKLGLTGTVASDNTETTEGTTAPAAQPVNYDFQLCADPKFAFADAAKYGKAENKDAIEGAYAAGTHNWKLEVAASTVSTRDDMKFYTDKGNGVEGLRLLNLVADEWIALRIKVAEAGNYEVALTGSNTSNYPYQATMYALAAPAAGTMTATDVEAAMTSANLVGVANITAGSSQDVAGEHTFVAGDNILIIKFNPNGDRASIQDIDLTPKAASPDTTDPSETTVATEPAKEEKIDFELYYNDAFSNEIKGGYEKYSNKKDLIANAYAAGTLNWKFEAVESGLEPKFVINNGTNQGIRTDSVNGKYVAIRFKVSEAAKYDVTYNSVYGYNFGAKTWIVPAPTADTVDIVAAMVDANKMGNVAITTSVLSCDLGSYDFAAGEYVLIFQGTGERLYMGNIVLTEVQGDQDDTTGPTDDTTEDTTAPEETTQPSLTVQDNVFDLELYNYDVFSGKVDGNYTKIGKFESTMNSAYPNSWNWKFEGFSADAVKSSIRMIGKIKDKADLGMKFGVSSAAGYYVAFRLNVTKAGKFDVVAKSLATSNFYTAKTWLVPVTSETLDAAALQAAMVDANALYDLSFAKDKQVSNLGEYDFAVGEYVLIVAPSAETAYLSSIELANPGEYEKPEEDTRIEYENKPGFFDMELYNYKGFDVLAAGFIKYNKAESLINGKYPAAINWKLEAYSEHFDTKDYIQFIGNGEGLRANRDDTTGGWIALRLNNTKAGKYDLIVNSNKGIWSGKVYKIPATAEAMTADQIAAAMIDANLMGKVNFTSETDRYNLGEFTFEAGEFILVLQADKNRVTVDSIEIAEHYVEPPKDPVDKIVYDLDLVKMDPNFNDKGFTNWYSRKPDGSGEKRVYTKIAEMYKDGSLNWKYETMSSTASRFNCREDHTQVKASTTFMDVSNAWNALRISAPGAGTYDVRLYCDTKSNVVADIYLIPAKTGIAMTKDEIEAAMTADNCLVKGTLIDGDGYFYFGEYTFGTEYEYVMVFKFTHGKKVYMNHIQMTKDGLVADTEVKKLPSYNGVVYDFDIGDKYTGILQPLGEYRYDAPTPKEAGYASPYEQIKSFWNSGKINWKWIASSEDLAEYDDNMDQYPNEYVRFYQDTGMYIYSKPDSWVAFQIKSPGSGDFTLTMNHAVAANDGTVAVYILPADTPLDEIWDATDPSNRVGKVLLTKEDGTSGKEDGHESFVGYWNFEAGKEYILVLEAYAASQFSATLSNMNISNIVMQKGIHEYKTDDVKAVKPVTVKERVLATSDLGNGNVAIFEMNGMDYYLTHLEGGTILLYNLTTGELEKENFASAARPRHMAVAPDGKVWMTGGGKFLYCYDPQENVVTKTKTWMPDEYRYNGPSYMTITPEGIIYFTMNQQANIVEYNPETKQFRDLGYCKGEEDYTNAIIYDDGYLYYNAHESGVHNWIIKYNLATGEFVAAVDVIESTDENITALSFLGEDILVCGAKTTYNDHTVALDKNTMERVDLGLPGSVSKMVTEEINGKQYMVLSSYGLYEYDVATKEIIKTPGFSEMTGSGFRAGAHHSYGKSWAIINGDLCLLSNDSQVTSCPRVVNLTKKEYYRWTDLTRDAVGGGSRIISFTETEPGAGELVMGLWNAEFIATYNIYTGEVQHHESAGQTDSIGYYKGILYGGCYSATVLAELHRDTNEIIQRFKLDHDITGQKRLLSMETGGDHVFVGSVPGTHINGGALTVYNTLNGQWYYERNIVQDQSIIDIAYWNEMVFVASSRAGGDNAPDMGDSALIVAYDYLNRKTMATLDLRDYIPGLTSPIHYVYGLTADPNAEENGRIWALVSDTLVCFTFDKETCKFDVQVVKDMGHTNYNISSGVARTQAKCMFIMEKNQMYVMFKDAGMQLITLEDWNAPVGQVKIAAQEKLMGYKPEEHIIAEDGNMYFGNDADLMMIPLNVTDEDWAIAEKMDAQIQAIHDSEITLASEAAIRTARSDYENLSWRYKALVQKLELLQEAESDILECKIDAGLLEAGEIDADDYPAMVELHDEYDGLTTTRQKRYVKNYKDLKEAYETSSDLNDQRIAAAMQKKVDALKELFPIESLEKEPDVVAVRTEFDALPGRQRILVDTTILEEAEAQIAVLRAELVKEVEKLIQAIPAEITLAAEPEITAAREGVNKLTALERKQVSYTKLEGAEAKLRNLKNALSKAEEFDALMKEIGIVTLGDAARIANARKVYNSLNETAKAFCTKAGKLKRAEFILAGLQTWMIPVIVVVDAAAIFAVVWFVPSLHNKVFKAKKKEEEPAETEN